MPSTQARPLQGLAGIEPEDPATRRVYELARRAALSSSNVLILGESGTGKAHLARLIHFSSPRACGPFVEISCANLPEDLIESELFGHEKGAFTGAIAARPGKFEQAHGGTVLIDGVGELSLFLQTKLLRILQERTIERLGGTRTLEVDLRFLASALPGLDDRVQARAFREDLYYRLNVVRLELPPLRQRGADRRRLAQRFLAKLRPPGGPRRFAPGAIDLIESYPWPGNIRELRNAIESALVTGRGEEIGPEDLPIDPAREPASLIAHAGERGFTLAQIEEAYIREVLRRTGGSKLAAARILGIHRKTLLEKRRRYGIE